MPEPESAEEPPSLEEPDLTQEMAGPALETKDEGPKGPTAEGAVRLFLSAPLYMSRSLKGETQDTDNDEIQVEPELSQSRSGLVADGVVVGAGYSPTANLHFGLQVSYSSSANTWVLASDDPAAFPLGDGPLDTEGFTSETVYLSTYDVGAFGEYLFIADGVFRPYAGASVGLSGGSMAVRRAADDVLREATASGFSVGVGAGAHLFVADNASIDLGVHAGYSALSAEDADPLSVSGIGFGFTLGLSTWLGGKPASQGTEDDPLEASWGALEGEGPPPAAGADTPADSATPSAEGAAQSGAQVLDLDAEDDEGDDDEGDDDEGDDDEGDDDEGDDE